MKPLLKTEGITKHYYVGKKVIHALDDISIDVYEKEIMGLVGESGSGKSTYGKCVIGLEDEDSGKFFFDNKDLSKLSRKEQKEIFRHMQMVFQNPYSSFNPKVTIGTNLLRLCKHFKMSKEDSIKRIEELFNMVKLGGELMKRLPGDLSGGQLQRLAIVRALIPYPKFIIADEAVSALDISVQAQVLNLFLEMKEEMGLSILFISHDLNVVQQICDRVAVLYLGKIVEIGPVDEIYDHTSHPYTESLILSKPKEHPDEEKRDVSFKGNGLSAVDIGNRCRFFGKCPYGEEGLCDKAEPELRKIGDNHFAACFKEAKEWKC